MFTDNYGKSQGGATGKIVYVPEVKIPTNTG